MPTPEGEARLLLLIDAFTTTTKGLEGRTKLAKLDFLLRYPQFLKRGLRFRNAAEDTELGLEDWPNSIEDRMIRFRYGPWDPAYFALLGSLIGRGLVRAIHGDRGLIYQVTDDGRGLARELATTPVWEPTAKATKILKRYFDLSGNTLKNFIYEHFPEVTGAEWGQRL